MFVVVVKLFVMVVVLVVMVVAGVVVEVVVIVIVTGMHTNVPSVTVGVVAVVSIGYPPTHGRPWAVPASSL